MEEERNARNNLLKWLSGKGVFTELHSQIVTEIEAQSDRSAAILASSMVEERLTDAIKSKLVVDDRVTKHLFSSYEAFTFSIKNRLCYGLGIYGRKTFRDIKKLKWVRNKFAHALLMPDESGAKAPISFDTSEIAAKCRQLQIISATRGKEDASPVPNAPRSIYILTGLLIVFSVGYLLVDENCPKLP